MKLRSFGFQSYKPFACSDERCHIDLAPLTLIFGHNSVGKSALVRLPLLLLRALSGQTRGSAFPLDVDGLSFGSRFADLVHGSTLTGEVSFSLELEHENERLSLSCRLQNIDDGRTGSARGVITHLDLSGALDLHLRWEPSHDKIVSYDSHGPVPFQGLLPEGPIDGIDFAPWRRRAIDLENRVEYLGPHRVAIRDVYSHKANAPLERDGAGAPFWLREDPDVEKAVSDWYRDSLKQGALEVVRKGDAFSLMLRRAGFENNLCFAGEGSQQVLPVVAQQTRHLLHDEGPELCIVEQPEVHLHDAAQGAVADLFIDTIKAGRGPILIETHSEIVLLRVRRRIAEDRTKTDDAQALRPKDVAIYWIDQDDAGQSTVRRVDLDADGNVPGWPQGVYGETFNEVAALNRAQR